MSEPKTRVRILRNRSIYTSFSYVRRGNGNIDSRKQARWEVRLDGSQVTESEGHPFHARSRKRRRGVLSDVGGPFYTVKRYCLDVPPPVVVGERETVWVGNDKMVSPSMSYCSIGLPRSLFGRTTRSPSDPGFQTDVVYSLAPSAFPPEVDPGDLDALGTTAISRCQPTRSPADLSSVLGELTREGLPSLIGATAWRDRTKALKGLSSEHLNYQFGIKPLVGEINSAVNTFRSMDDKIAQFERDAGKLVRRKYFFPVRRSEVTRTLYPTTGDGRPLGAFIGPTSSHWGGSVPKAAPYSPVVRERVTSHRVWFSGAFTYALPKGMAGSGILASILSRADRLGLDPDLDTIWELAPWSWAVDWFSNVGGIISNVSAMSKYGLVLRYGYVMCHTVTTDTYYPANYGIRYLATGPIRGDLPSMTLVTESKRRVRATPFGFGVNMGDLSSLQYSILAALGISRGR